MSKVFQMGAGSKVALFEQTVLPHLNSAYNLARWLTRNEHDADDVVQEAYLRAYRFFDGFQGIDAKAWLLAVVRNTYLTWVRQKRGEMFTTAFDERTHRSGRDEENTETTLVRDAKLGCLRDCIDSLPIEYREVVVMREIEEMSYKEISEVAGLPIGTVMSRLSRARRRLLECVTERLKEHGSEVFNHP